MRLCPFSSAAWLKLLNERVMTGRTVPSAARLTPLNSSEPIVKAMWSVP